MPPGQAQGLAFHASYGGYVAQVAEISVSGKGALRVEKVVCVCDVGEQIVNLSGAEHQVQGAILDGLSAAWLQGLDFEHGRTVQSNFHDYPLLRIGDAPSVVEVHFLRSDNPTTGLGEPALPPVAPAVCNAIHRAVGLRVRELPIARHLQRSA
jgi:isoquinoline 1-oxidoreductase beta subunit